MILVEQNNLKYLYYNNALNTGTAISGSLISQHSLPVIYFCNSPAHVINLFKFKKTSYCINPI